MVALNEMNIVNVNKYDSVTLEEYQGKYYLREVRNATNDNFYLKWVAVEEWNDSERKFTIGNKKMPQGVHIGDDKEQAIAVLSTVLVKLKGGEPEPIFDAIIDIDDDDIPF